MHFVGESIDQAIGNVVRDLRTELWFRDIDVRIMPLKGIFSPRILMRLVRERKRERDVDTSGESQIDSLGA